MNQIDCGTMSRLAKVVEELPVRIRGRDGNEAIAVNGKASECGKALKVIESERG